MTHVPTIHQLATRTRQINASNDWGTDFTPAQIPQFLALIHSEITEAHHERDRAKRARELGDVMVRCLDLCELIRSGLIGSRLTTLWHHRPNLLTRVAVRLNRSGYETRLHARASAALETFRKAPADQMPGQVVVDLSHLICLANFVLLCEQPRGTTPTNLISEILDANSARGKRHGGRRC